MTLNNQKQKDIVRLGQLYSSFLEYPLENFSLYYKMKPPTIDETKDWISQGFGGDCTALSNLIDFELEKDGFNSKIIYFDNNVPEIDKTIKITKEIDGKYHCAVVVDINSEFYLLDVGLQYEKPIKLFDGEEYHFPTKDLKVKRNDTIFTITRFDRGAKIINLKCDILKNWSSEENKKAASNNIYRNIPLKFGILKEDYKIGLKMKGQGFYVVKKNKESIETLVKGSLESCANYLGLGLEIVTKAYENWTNLRKEQGVL